MDLRKYLKTVAERIYHLSEPVATAYGITATQTALDNAGLFPLILAERPLLADGRVASIPVLTNLCASRHLVAAALGIADHRQAAAGLTARITKPIAPVVVERGQAPVQEVVLEGAAADLTALPVLTQHVLDPGPYLTAAHATTVDPESGIDNTAIQRCWIKGPREMSFYPYPSSHNAHNMRKYWAKGEPCPIAFWIGHHPAVVVGSQAKLPYPASHWPATGGMAGAAVRLVPSLTHGDKLMVPADAEIVIEGWLHPERYTVDGPFGEYTGYLGPQTIAPLCEVTAITHRTNAIYHDYGSGHPDMLVPDNMVMESKIYSMIKPLAPSLQNVHVPNSGRRFHAYLQFKNPLLGEVRDALTAALGYRRTKAAIAVDEDVDIFTEEEILWALATRVHWQRDSFVLNGLSTSTLDPSLPPGAKTGAKIAIDATQPPAVRSGGPKPVPPRMTVPDADLNRALERLAAVDNRAWPRA